MGGPGIGRKVSTQCDAWRGVNELQGGLWLTTGGRDGPGRCLGLLTAASCFSSSVVVAARGSRTGLLLQTSPHGSGQPRAGVPCPLTRQEGPGGRAGGGRVAPKRESQAGGMVTHGARTKCQALPGSLAHGTPSPPCPPPPGLPGRPGLGHRTVRMPHGTPSGHRIHFSVQSSLSSRPTDPFDVCSLGTGFCVEGGLRPTALCRREHSGPGLPGRQAWAVARTRTLPAEHAAPGRHPRGRVEAGPAGQSNTSAHMQAPWALRAFGRGRSVSPAHSP